MLILDVEKQTGLDRATIRFYEKEEIIIPIRAENGYRTYSDSDVQILLKVKLLRQLGFSLPKIKNLQKGSVDFSEILSQQIEILESQIKENTVAKLVCQKMREDGVHYSNLDSGYYLHMLFDQSISNLPTSHSFSEKIEREVHPWRRYFARKLDYQLVTALLQLLLIVILRIRPFTSTAIEFLTYAACFLAIPVLAAILHYFGTTPGKWAMGIRLESIHGGKLSGGEALYREGKIIWHGMGMFIPILHLAFLYRSYIKDKEGLPQVWNEDTEIIYTTWNAKRKIIAVVLFIVSFSVSVLAVLDAVMPTYRGEGITIAEFAENHRDYEKQENRMSEYMLDNNGKWQLRPTTNTLYYLLDDPEEADREEFVYHLNENSEIQSITFENSWKNDGFIRVLPSYCETAIYVIVGSRPGSNFMDISEVRKLLFDEYNNVSQQEGEVTGNITIRDVTISWTAFVENCQSVQSGVMYAEDGEVLSSKINLEIKIG